MVTCPHGENSVSLLASEQTTHSSIDSVSDDVEERLGMVLDTVMDGL